MNEMEALKKELAEAKARLADIEKSIPAHSIRAHQIAALEEAEEDVALLQANLERLRKEEGE